MVAPEGNTRLPNIIVLVLDAVRADVFQKIFESQWGGVGKLSNLPLLRSESVRFANAASVSSWTLPAHASLFTGLYPWQHGLHARHSLELSTDQATLAVRLGGHGYRSISLSANPLLDSDSGILRGFDQVLTASAEAHLHRWASIDLGLGQGMRTAQNLANGERRIQVLGEGFSQRILSTFPFLADGWNRVARKLRPDDFDPSSLSVSPWIEMALGMWIAKCEPNKPIFAFVNLIDAHEPFLTDVNEALSLSRWWKAMRVPQYQAIHVLHPERFNSDDRAVLFELYAAIVRNLAYRVDRIVGLLRAQGRWDNTLLVVTSDHGQEFGEHGWLFHGIRVDEPLIRVPLWVRFPGARHSGTQPASWASLIDVAPTALHAAGILNSTPCTGIPLDELIDRNSREPILAAADGFAYRSMPLRWFPPDRYDDLDRVRVAAYAGNRKVILTEGRAGVQAFDLSADAAEQHDLWPTEGSSLEDLRRAAADALSKMTAPMRIPLSASTRERLSSWGYL